MSTPSPTHDRAAILSTGDELVLGESLDTNSRDLADRLLSLGIEVVEHITLGDDRPGTAAALRRLAQSVPLIITTGGLGPTQDDVMREALADALGEPLILDDRALARLESRFASRGRPMTDNQRRQAQRPASAACIHNHNGTAPGLHAVLRAGGRHDAADIFCLPGPPPEWRPMFERSVAPMLRPPPGRIVVTRLIHAVGIGEGDAAARLGPLLDRGRSPQVGITVAGGVVTLRVRCLAAHDRAQAESLVAADERTIRQTLAPYIFGQDHDTLAASVLRRLIERRGTIAVVESCTGGLLGAMLTAVPGSSAAVAGGWITYSNRMKAAQVGVPDQSLKTHGAVSEQVAHEMAVGGLQRAAMDGAAASAAGGHCLSITGIAGPDGGTPAKPVGTVFIAHAWHDQPGQPGQPGRGRAAPHVDVRRFLISGTREEIRQRAATTALAMLHLGLEGDHARASPLLWQVPLGGLTGAGTSPP